MKARIAGDKFTKEEERNLPDVPDGFYCLVVKTGDLFTLSAANDTKTVALVGSYYDVRMAMQALE